jgi:hypothetical protein
MATMPLDVVWMATGNNVQLGSDMARRVLPIRLESPLEKPEERSDFQQADLLAFVRGRLSCLVGAALTILRACHLAGRPSHKAATWGSFSQWQAFVCGAVVWAGLASPEGARLAIATVDGEGEVLLGLLAALRRNDSQGDGRSAADILHASESDEDLADSLAAACGRPLKELAPHQVGYRLRKFRGRIVEGLSLQDRKGRGRKSLWFVAVHGGDGADWGRSSWRAGPAHLGRRISPMPTIATLRRDCGTRDLTWPSRFTSLWRRPPTCSVAAARPCIA